MYCAKTSLSTPTFAGLDALGPCMAKLFVAGISTALEPSAAASATAALASLVSSAFGASTTAAALETPGFAADRR